MPPGDFDKLLKTAHAARCAIMLRQIFACTGDVSERVKVEIRAMREATEGTEKTMFPVPMARKIIEAMMGGK